MKKVLSLLLGTTLVFSMTACTGTSGATGTTQSSEAVKAQEQVLDETHKIGVLVYDLTDEEVQSFKDYLENYVASCFEGVEFVYSDSITSEDEELYFIDQACDSGVEGIMSFNSYDLEEEVEACAENEVYYMMASGTVDEASFESVKDNPYFLGVIGPGSETEYDAGADMAQYFYELNNGNSYFVLSGGASMGNEMHLQRTLGMLDTLAADYGVTFDDSTEDMAMVSEPEVFTAGDLTVCVAPGYLDFEEFLTSAKEAYQAGEYPNVLSALTVSAIIDTLDGSKVGCVDCFSDSNLSQFAKGSLSYVSGKYRSIIGPSFVAMYNAVCGYADKFREDGHAFSLTQGFWTATEKEQYEKMYALSSSIELNAYNYEDLTGACYMFNQDASLTDIKNLTDASNFEDAVARRGLEE